METAVGHLGSRNIAAIVYADLGFLVTLLGSNDDDTVSSTGTVDCSCSGVLQNLHGLNVVRVDGVDVDSLYTVHDDQWVGTVNGAHTTYTDSGLSCRTTGVVDGNTCCLTLKCLSEGCYRNLGQSIAGYNGNRTGDILLCLGGVSYYDNILKYLGVFNEDNLHFASCDFHFLSDVAHVGNNKCGVVVHVLKGEITIKVGDGSVGSTLYQNGSSDNRFTILVNYLTLYGCHDSGERHTA